MWESKNQSSIWINLGKYICMLSKRFICDASGKVDTLLTGLEDHIDIKTLSL